MVVLRNDVQLVTSKASAGRRAKCGAAGQRASLYTPTGQGTTKTTATAVAETAAAAVVRDR